MQELLLSETNLQTICRKTTKNSGFPPYYAKRRVPMVDLGRGDYSNKQEISNFYPPPLPNQKYKQIKIVKYSRHLFQNDIKEKILIKNFPKIYSDLKKNPISPLFPLYSSASAVEVEAKPFLTHNFVI